MTCLQVEEEMQDDNYKVLSLEHIQTAPKAIKDQLTIERDVLRRFGFRDDEMRIIECDKYKWQIVPVDTESSANGK